MAEMGMQLEEITSPWRFAALRAEWESLADRSPGLPFLRWSWLFPWWSRLGQSATPLVVLVRDDQGELRGLLPLCSAKAGGLRIWRFLGDSFVGSDGLQPLLERGWEQAAGDALADWIAQASDRWDLLKLRDLPTGHPWLGVLEERLERKSLVGRRGPGNRCPVVSLLSDAPRWPRRDNFQRRRRWLQQQPSWQITHASAPSEVGAALGHFLRLHALRWGSRWSDAIAGPAVEGFHREAATALAGRALYRIHLMWLDGQPVAGVLGLVDRSAFYYYLPVFDPAWSHRSVGLVLLGTLMERAAAEGLGRFELLRGEEPYKVELTGAGWRTCTFTAVAHRVAPAVASASWSAASKVRALASSVAPVRAVDLWRLALARLSLKSSGWG